MVYCSALTSRLATHAGRAMSDKEKLHRLIDELPEAELLPLTLGYHARCPSGYSSTLSRRLTHAHPVADR